MMIAPGHGACRTLPQALGHSKREMSLQRTNIAHLVWGKKRHLENRGEKGLNKAVLGNVRNVLRCFNSFKR